MNVLSFLKEMLKESVCVVKGAVIYSLFFLMLSSFVPS